MMRSLKLSVTSFSAMSRRMLASRWVTYGAAADPMCPAKSGAACTTTTSVSTVARIPTVQRPLVSAMASPKTWPGQKRGRHAAEDVDVGEVGVGVGRVAETRALKALCRHVPAPTPPVLVAVSRAHGGIRTPCRAGPHAEYASANFLVLLPGSRFAARMARISCRLHCAHQRPRSQGIAETIGCHRGPRGAAEAPGARLSDKIGVHAELLPEQRQKCRPC